MSSILEKVRSKEEAEAATKTSISSKQRLLAPLASTESLSVSDTSSKRLSTSVDSTASSKYFFFSKSLQNDTFALWIFLLMVVVALLISKIYV